MQEFVTCKSSKHNIIATYRSWGNMDMCTFHINGRRDKGMTGRFPRTRSNRCQSLVPSLVEIQSVHHLLFLLILLAFRAYFEKCFL